MSKCPEIEVLLATFNGERFLREQVDSILAQDYPNLRVLARDDGSSDGTVSILKEYSELHPGRFRLMPASSPTGTAKDNFLLLMRASTADYICFSDQDDVWLPDKVKKARDAMEGLERRWGPGAPLLVFSDLRVVDDRLEVQNRSFWARMSINPKWIDRLAELLGRSVVTGCAAMVNRRLLELALRMPADAFMHDHWIALLASTLGKSGIIRAQTVLYRQHDRNLIGLGGGESASLVNRLRGVCAAADGNISPWQLSQQQARALLRIHGAELPADRRDLLSAYVRCETSESRFVRIGTFLRHRFFFVGLRQNIAIVLHLWKLGGERR